MNSLIDQFCESPRRWLIVTVVTFVLGLVILVPQVDQYVADCSEHVELTEQLAEASRTAAELPDFEMRAEVTLARLVKLENRTVRDKNLTAHRASLMAIARECGCQIRRLNVGNPQTQPWDPSATPNISMRESPKGDALTPFVLVTRPTLLSVTGPMTGVKEVMQSLQEDKKMMHAKLLDLRPTGRNRKGVQMDLELWYFALEPYNGV